MEAAIEGVRDALQSGDITGYPVTDVAVTLAGMERRDGLTTAPGCHMAAGQALREALAAAAPVNLEPSCGLKFPYLEIFWALASGFSTPAPEKWRS